MQKTILISTLIFFQFIPAFAQQPIFKTYTVSDGLVNNSVRRIFQDSKGFLWIATWEGLSKYDGNRFTNFTESNGLSHNLVNDVAETKDGSIYVAMNNGTVDVIRNNEVKQNGIVKDIVINKLELTKEGNLLALTDNRGIIEITPKSRRRFIQNDTMSFYGLVNLNDSFIAVATLPHPVFIYDHRFQVRAFYKPDFRNNPPNCIYKDLQDRLWLGTGDGLKLISDFRNTSDVRFKQLQYPFNNPLLSQGNISSLLQQKNGNFWIGTDNGLINIRPDGQLIQFTEKDGLPSRNVTYLFSDRENNLWIGTRMGLVKIIAASPEKIYDPSQESPHGARLIKKISNEQVLILSGNFFYRYNFRTGETQNITQLKKETEFVDVTNSIPPLFIHDNQLQVYDMHANQLTSIKKIPPANNFFSATTTANQRNIFIGTFNGIVVCSNDKIVKDSTFSMRITNVRADQKGNVWIGTWDRGLYRARYDETNGKWEDVIHFTQLPDNHIRSLFEDSKGNMWAGTRFNGVVEIKEKPSTNFEFLHFNQQTGLSSNWISDITEDEKENIWLATMSGLDKLIKKENGFSVFNYSRVINFFINTNLVTHLQGNKLLCSTLIGTYQIKDEELEELSPAPVALTKVTLGSSGQNELALHEASEKLTLPYSKNHALFEFTSPIFINEKEILYSYRLKGSGDTAWSHPSNSHSVQYASLKPGHYLFEVRMLGWNGSYGPATSFLFTVRPPYWNTWWFYSLIVLIALLAFYSLYRYRINHLLRLQKVRNTIATDLHDDIGSTLTNISILSELSKKNLEEPPVAKKYLQRITEESVATQQALDDIIWSVNSRNDNMQELQARMRRYAGEIFESSNINCQFDFENTTESNKLNMEQRRDVYLVFKECLNNIHKHASAKNIYIKIAMSNGVLTMLVEDDGKGFDPNITTHRNGLKNLQTRVEKWKGNLKIDSARGKGARVEIMMPVKTFLLK
jgi:ligand-binding sensor domain-containing protein/two-component sensor histidine kinase